MKKEKAIFTHYHDSNKSLFESISCMECVVLDRNTHLSDINRQHELLPGLLAGIGI